LEYQTKHSIYSFLKGV